ncbi:nuclear transport factor 2 family protein [Psychroflexus sp. ALD_RP9]|uniref:nuclear transport factor 2 family protein n=1 Tax=Psychroflexus sp. ALD_RP9 TaxID=2777186 RepID=UPI001A909AC1|nr:nuclear transport factor 2 family protein [Psychroflexus sp. ALD_RP9]QSS97958.1 nuclear transport factor 2 family protein [Psychroflexus sp. ALD_RP9]
MNALLKRLNSLSPKIKLVAVLIFTVNLSLAQEHEEKINQTLNHWHKAAASANAEKYFNLMTEDAVFVGSDADEVWSLKDFKTFAMPYFKKGKAWTFTSIKRNLYINSKNIAWFDEVLTSTHMGLCRGSGIVELVDHQWKVKHYVLSILVPNELVDQANEQKKQHDSEYINKLKN